MFLWSVIKGHFKMNVNEGDDLKNASLWEIN